MAGGNTQHALGASAAASAEMLAEFLARHPATLVLTGAGLSTASGIPDYRDRDGVRRGKEPIQGPDFRRSPAVQRRYWARSMVGWPVLAQARPNGGHTALAALEAAGRIGSLLTQNVDGLHQQAGSQAVLELHGNIHSVICLDCGMRTSRAAVQAQLVASNPAMAVRFAGALAKPLPDGDAQLEPGDIDALELPACTQCKGTLMPDVIFFGDNLPAARRERALAQMDAADALLVVGSSLMVYSGFRFCRLAQAAGKPIAAVNLGRTRADDLISLKIAASAEHLLPQVATLLHTNTAPTPIGLIQQRGVL